MKRYDFDFHDGMTESVDGDWVHYEDYERLTSRLEAIAATLEFQLGVTDEARAMATETAACLRRALEAM